MIPIPGMKYVALAGVILALVFAVLWQHERATTAELRGVVAGQKQINEIAMTALATNEKAFDGALGLAKLDQDSVKQLRGENDALNSALVQRASDDMRSSYERELEAKKDSMRGGRVSGIRINDSLCRAAGYGAGCNSDQSAGAGDGGSAEDTVVSGERSDSVDVR